MSQDKIIILRSGGGGSGVVTSAPSVRPATVTQTAHGFSAKQVVYHDGTAWALAQANALATSIGLAVIESASTNTFVLVQFGGLTASGFTAATQYYLSAATPGALTVTPPSTSGQYIVPVLYAQTTTEAFVDIEPPLSLVPVPVLGGGTGATTAAAAVVNLTPASVAVAASAIDWSAGMLFTKTLAANTTFTFSNATDGQTISVHVTNTASNYTVTWPTVQWAGGVAPTQTVGAKTDVYTFQKVGSTIRGTASQDHS